ncbi:RNA-guided pseudouridylation complex pseudouridine synthase subunit Cbf5 [Candidatus Nanohalobium constans]|uniref:RNA-guided pseudouridylation complex pseudouridine synthase subunit Cbf5 n=1 Tax=Candidatus Nanohalobium constans TaxID=2565781 RepID=A0A5Q0UJF6_9ARCH|nr:RNA-guided pseudouridylation complex pseudouridine synthase subunit Cbf5 [Candidatus Nanohalobium constans]QGA80959.1 RNA-guided pseudouridylation complex pseudouridine synthase subunit Cbf5 [Candidatus Nanohalobium constans]
MEWYTREEAETDPEFGKIPEKRTVEELLQQGFVVIDKPFGPTSNQVSHWIKEELDREKTGHFGTLDPNATGVLPVGLDSGTRIQDALTKARKEYIFEAKLAEEKDEEKIQEAIQEFEGTNKQVPPEMSAVKQEERKREVYEIELLEKEEKKFLGRVKCESGFYVRVLIQQLGEKLGTEASMEELRRTQQGNLTTEDTHTLQDLVDAYRFYKDDGDKEQLEEILQPIERAVQHMKKAVIKDSAVNAVANGSNLGSTGISKLQDGIQKGETIAIMTLKGELVALAKAKMTSEEMFDEEDTAAELQKVFMDPSNYPRRWKQE